MKSKILAIFATLYITLIHTSEISIRFSQPHDIPALCALNENVLDEYFGPTLITGYPEYFANNEPLLLQFNDSWNEMFKTLLNEGINNLDNHHILVASHNEDPNNIIGLCAFTKENDSIYLQYLIVSEKSRGQGTGKKLLDNALSMYPDVRTCWLETIANANEKTHAFYERYGFTTTKELYTLVEYVPNTHIIYTLNINK